MKKILIGITILLISGCGSRGTDPYFSPYVDADKDYCEIYNGEGCSLIGIIYISFKDTLESEGLFDDAYCYRGQISINLLSWAGMDEDQRQIIILHELGHCAFGMKDNHTVDETGRPTSIMYYSPMVISPYWKEYKDDYLREFFGGDSL